MQILVTGGAGYIGSVLVRMLLETGHRVKCLDRFFFGKNSLEEVISNPNLEIIKDDIRWFDPTILKNVDVVMDLAALSNDPAGELDPSKTFDINYLGRTRVARMSKEHGVKRYILASSCSVYGFNKNEGNDNNDDDNDNNALLDETSKINPLTSYAKANAKAEEDVLLLSNSNFAVTALRFATVYGYSARMRFDLAINAMVLALFKGPKIPVMRDGRQWRPFMHIKDAAMAYKLVMDTAADKINGQIFNIGFDEQNYQILPLSELIGKSLNVDYEIDWYGSADSRSYKVSFKKLKEMASSNNNNNFRPLYSPQDGALEVFKALKLGKIKDSLQTKTVEWYKYLINSYELMSEVTIRNTLL
jgi:nucleoside-diphosphate-sugar epimerase